MCLTVFVASDKPLEPIVWDKTNPGIHSNPYRKRLRGLHAPYVIEVGSHEGCGCGFLQDEGEEDPSSEMDRQQLTRYLENAAQDASVQVLISWAYDSKEPLVRHGAPFQIWDANFDHVFAGQPELIHIRVSGAASIEAPVSDG